MFHHEHQLRRFYERPAKENLHPPASGGVRKAFERWKLEFHEHGELLVTEGPNRNRITNPGDGRIGWFRTAKKLIGAFSNVCVCVCLLVFLLLKIRSVFRGNRHVRFCGSKALCAESVVSVDCVVFCSVELYVYSTCMRASRAVENEIYWIFE